MAAVVWIGVVCSAGLAQQTTTSQPAETEAAARGSNLTPEVIQGRIKQAESIADEGLRKKVVETYQQALELLQKSVNSQERLEQLKKDRETAPAQMAEIKTKLAEPMEKPKPGIPPGSTLPQLEQLLAKLQAEQDTAEKRKGELETRLKMRTERRLKLPEMAAKAKQCLEDAREQMKLPAGAETPDALAQAQRSFLVAQIRACRADSQVYEEDLLGYDIRTDLLRAQLDLISRDFLIRQKDVTAWREVVDRYRREEADRMAARARAEAAMALPGVRKLAEENAALTELASGSEGLAAKIEQVARKAERVDKQFNEIRNRYRSIQAMVDKAGVTNAISLLLRKDRSNLPDVEEYRTERTTIQEKIANSNFQLIQFEEERSSLTDIDAAVNKILASLTTITTMPEDQRKEIEKAAREELRTKATYLTNLVNYYDAYIEKLVQLDTAEKDLIQETKAFADYIDEHVLWFQSTGPLGPNTVLKTWEAVQWLVNPYGWYQVMQLLGMDTAYNLSLNGVVLIIFICLLVLRRWFIRQVRQSGLPAKDDGVESYWRTMEALAFTVLISLVWPLLLWFIGWRLDVSSEATDFSRAMAVGFKGMAVLCLTLELIMNVCLSDGLAEAHFRWISRNLKSIRGNATWLLFLSLPMMFLTLTMENQGNDLWRDSLGRLAYMVMMMGFGVCFWRIVGPSVAGQRFPSNWMGWLRYFWYPFFVVPFILVVLAGFGYYYTAVQLGWKMLESFWLLLGLLLVQEMMLRWLYLAQRRLAIAKIERLRTQAKTKEPKLSTASEPAPAPREPEMNIFTISTQNRKLLRSVMGFAMLIGLWFIWNDFLPALGVLRRVHLWEEVTLASFLLAILITVMTIIADKNIPGLLEVTVLHKLPLDAGSRFAIATLSRYMISVVGLVVAFDLIGIGWSKIQWLIAAITVGLGFGLQEIFANFISGLIILFERPIRVGDVVTVGEVSGTVSRIHIRATTIIDWDRKELIVPNKEFITGRVINWTLSDRVLRLLIKVGVAYGTDTDKVQRLLMEAAESNPAILKDPSPSAIFTGFGDSSLDFELRAYIPNVDHVLTLRHELYTAVDKKFKAAGIEIPFPQRDMHVRTIKDALAVQQEQKMDPS
jgi:potassium efflux system protein